MCSYLLPCSFIFFIYIYTFIRIEFYTTSQKYVEKTIDKYKKPIGYRFLFSFIIIQGCALKFADQNNKNSLKYLDLLFSNHCIMYTYEKYL